MNTLAAAEQLYDALYTWNRVGSITVTSTSLAFFKDLSSSVTAGTYASGSSTYTTLYNAVKTYADGYVLIVQQRLGTNGALSEQFDRNTGAPLSAADLTWSYAAFLTMAQARAGAMPPTWGEPAASAVPAVCYSTGVAGTYSTATSTSWPSSQTPITGSVTTTGTATTTRSTTATGTATTTTSKASSSTTTSCAAASSVAVTFSEKKVTAYGDTIKISGSVAALGSWNTGNAVALSASAYTSANPVWSGTITLAAGTVIQYKYILVSSSGTVTWEADPNHTYTVPATCATAVSVSNTWQ